MLWYKPNFKKSKKLKEHVNKIWKHLTFADISHLFSYLNKRNWVFYFSQYDDEILTVYHFIREWKFLAFLIFGLVLNLYDFETPLLTITSDASRLFWGKPLSAGDLGVAVMSQWVHSMMGDPGRGQSPHKIWKFSPLK